MILFLPCLPLDDKSTEYEEHSGTAGTAPASKVTGFIEGLQIELPVGAGTVLEQLRHQWNFEIEDAKILILAQ